MRSRRPEKERLRLHRETLRSLSGESLERVAGGTSSLQCFNNPRTNAWTAGLAYAVCGGGGLR